MAVVFVAAGFIGGGNVDVAAGGKADIVGADYVANFIESRNRPPTLASPDSCMFFRFLNLIFKYYKTGKV
ncbi:hypothetical protein [Methylomusa anaerophila]|uniref:hypothetical protein n=1 Tax=Methylomusa anaerophila TaxID=1930071 RepID=UPI000F836699|nr:hypothetical protein [Methylomusa anaerophila]